ncbi:MAG: DUF192 domain-containing protein [Acidimicrobiales bacterium]
MGWLVRDGEVLASVEIARDRRARMRGLLGRDGIDGVLLLSPARSVHTFRMRFPIDVAYVGRDEDDADDLRVLKVRTMERNRLGLPVWRAVGVLEAEAGVMRSWGLAAGDRLRVRGGDEEAGRPGGRDDR